MVYKEYYKYFENYQNYNKKRHYELLKKNYGY